MIIVSIHPFAFRKVFLVLLALLGFSALCFADPVLMAHRYDRHHSRVALRLPERPLNQLSEMTAQDRPEITGIALEKANAPELWDSSLCFQTQPHQCALKGIGDPASAPFFLADHQ
jgi:hypothetical protein